MAQRSSVHAYGRDWPVILKDNGEVWYEDEHGHEVQIGRGRASSIEAAEQCALEMLRQMGPNESFEL